MTPGKVKEHFGQQMGSLLSPEYWCNSQFVAKFMVQIWVAINLAQEYNINGQFLWPVYLPKVWLCHIISAQLHVIEAQERHEKSPKKGTSRQARCWFSEWLLICNAMFHEYIQLSLILELSLTERRMSRSMMVDLHLLTTKLSIVTSEKSFTLNAYCI